MSIQTVNFFWLESVHLCKFASQCPDVLADKLHTRFDKKNFEQKGAAYTLAFTVRKHVCRLETIFIIGCNAWLLSYGCSKGATSEYPFTPFTRVGVL